MYRCFIHVKNQILVAGFLQGECQLAPPGLHRIESVSSRFGTIEQRTYDTAGDAGWLISCQSDGHDILPSISLEYIRDNPEWVGNDRGAGVITLVRDIRDDESGRVFSFRRDSYISS